MTNAITPAPPQATGARSRCSIRLDGSTNCIAIEGAADSEVFTTYVGKVLRPALRAGDIVIMDNLATHKAAAVLERITQAGATAVFLPAYSPDLNPIEKMWSKTQGPAPRRRAPHMG